MSKSQANALSIDLSKLSPEQVVALAQAGIIEVNGNAPDNGQASPPAPEANADIASAYKGYFPPAQFATLHPIAKRGTPATRAILNAMVVTGTCSTKGVSVAKAYDSRSGVELVSEGHVDGKVVSKFYAQRTNVDGKTMDGRAPAFFKAGGRVRVDLRTKTAELVDIPDGFEFSPESVKAITAIVNGS